MLTCRKILVCLVFILIIKLNAYKAAALPANGNNTKESTAMAKTSTTIMDIFEDIRWFFERLTIFSDIVEKMLPPERKEIQQLPLSVSLTLQTGLRHFIFGVREISTSIVRVLSDKEVREYKQLSRATDFAHDLVKSIGEFFRNLRMVIGNLFAAYTFYIPEVLFCKCMGNYLLQSYPNQALYEYPILLVNDIIDAFRKSISVENEISMNATESDRKLGSGSEIEFHKNVEQNEILDEDMYVFHNTPVSPSPELTIKNKESEQASENETPKFDVEDILEDHMEELQEKLEENVAEVSSWQKCAQMYATETIFRKLEVYFLEMKE